MVPLSQIDSFLLASDDGLDALLLEVALVPRFSDLHFLKIFKLFSSVLELQTSRVILLIRPLVKGLLGARLLRNDFGGGQRLRISPWRLDDHRGVK